MRTIFRVLAINPESTITRIAIFDNEKCIIEETLRHDLEELNRFPHIMDQYAFRKQMILDTVNEKGMNITKLGAVVAKADMIQSISAGTYKVNRLMLEDLSLALAGEHASNLGPIIAHEIASPLNIPAFVVHPPIVDEVELQVLAENCLRVLRGEEIPKICSVGEIKEAKPIGN